jgi:hypothetical protein
MNQILSRQKKRNNQKIFSSENSNDDVIMSSIRDVSIIAESVSSSSIFKLTKAKRAKIDITTANTAIIELADAVKIAFQIRTTFIIIIINQKNLNDRITSLNDRKNKLKHEMQTTKRNRKL